MKEINVNCYFINDENLDLNQAIYYMNKWGYSLVASSDKLIIRDSKNDNDREINNGDLFLIEAIENKLLILQKDFLEDVSLVLPSNKIITFNDKSNEKIDEEKEEGNEDTPIKDKEDKVVVKEEKKENKSTFNNKEPALYKLFVTQNTLKDIYFGKKSCLLRKVTNSNETDSLTNINKSTPKSIGDIIHFIIREEVNGKIQFTDKYPLNKYEVTDVKYGSDSDNNGIKKGFVLICFKMLQLKK